MNGRGAFSHLICALALCGALAETLPAEAQEPNSAPPPRTSQSKAVVPNDTLPDSPGAVRSSSHDATRTASSIAQLQQGQDLAEGAAQSESNAPQRPVGTAAAEAPNVSAIAGSEPAGVAIAPAKQHRVRTIILRTGAIIGAGVAIGAVVALTAATPPKPPGAH